MSEDRGSVLTSNILAFGIAAFCFVSLRTSFRLYTRKISASDWVLVMALVSSVLPLTSVKESTQRRVASKPEIWPFGLMIIRQISSLAQDSFNAACELCHCIVVLSIAFRLIAHLQALPNGAMVITVKISQCTSALLQSH